MQFYPFDTLHIKPNHVVVWLRIEPIAQGCAVGVALGDVHKHYPKFRAVSVLPPSDCLGGEVHWEAPFMAAPEEVLRMVSALRAPAPITTASPLPNYVSCVSCNAEGVAGEVPHTGDCQDYGSC